MCILKMGGADHCNNYSSITTMNVIFKYLKACGLLHPEHEQTAARVLLMGLGVYLLVDVVTVAIAMLCRYSPGPPDCCCYDLGY